MGLSFRPYESSGRAELEERQELYKRLAEWVWNPSSLDLDGEKPRDHQPIVDNDDEESGGTTAIGASAAIAFGSSCSPRPGRALTSINRSRRAVTIGSARGGMANSGTIWSRKMKGALNCTSTARMLSKIRLYSMRSTLTAGRANVSLATLSSGTVSAISVRVTLG